jgi:hypothetical protein
MVLLYNNPSRLRNQAWLLELSIFFLEAKSTVDMVVLPNQVVAMSKPRKGKNFNQEKETKLCQKFLHVLQDPIIGKAQKSQGF